MRFDPRRTRNLTAALGIMVGVAACSQPAGGDTSASPSGGAGAAGAAGKSDLRIGYVLPETGGIAFLGPGMIGSVKLAVDDINAAGGVNNMPVKLTGGDEGGADGTIAGQTVDRLLNTDQVAAVIGAGASGVSLKIIDKITGAGVVECAPSNTSPSFTTYKDNGFYFRAAPSDLLLAPVYSKVVTEEGAKRVALLSRADDYGRALVDAVSKEFKKSGTMVSDPVLYDPTTKNFDAEVRKVAAFQPDAIVLVAFDESAAVLRKLIEAKLGPKDVKIYAGTGTKNAALAKQVNPNDGASVQGLRGVNPAATSNADFLSRLKAKVPSLSVTQYTGESYDCATLVALAAQQAKSSDPKSIRDNLVKVSRDGEKCTSFADCKKLLDAGKDIDYDGVSGPIDFTDAGDPSKATYDEWEFQADGSIKVLGSVKTY